MFSIIIGNCKTYNFSIMEQRGLWGEIVMNEKFTRKDRPSKDGQMIYKTLRFACSIKPDKVIKA
jgi:hypothetical protein